MLHGWCLDSRSEPVSASRQVHSTSLSFLAPWYTSVPLRPAPFPKQRHNNHPKQGARHTAPRPICCNTTRVHWTTSVQLSQTTEDMRLHSVVWLRNAPRHKTAARSGRAFGSVRGGLISWDSTVAKSVAHRKQEASCLQTSQCTNCPSPPSTCINSSMAQALPSVRPRREHEGHGTFTLKNTPGHSVSSSKVGYFTLLISIQSRFRAFPTALEPAPGGKE